MKNRMKPVLFLLGVVLVFCFLRTPAEAAVSFTAVQTSPAEIVMGTRPVTYRITNTSTAGESINRIRFNLANNTYTSYPNPEAFTAPAGWTCTRSSNTRIQCTGTMPSTGTNYGDFTFNIKNVVTTYDRTDKLNTVQARFSTSNTNYNPNPLPTTSWTWKALEMTLVPAPTNIGTGCTTTLTMTVWNRSSVANLVVAPVSSPPTLAGGAAVNAPAPAPASLTLAANGGTGSITWAYTVTGLAGGTVKFTACASTTGTCVTNPGVTRTSSSVTTGPVTIIAGAACNLVSAMTITPTCLYSGDIATVQMVVQNKTGATVNNVTPGVITCIGPAQIGSPACTWLTGPTPANMSLLTNATGTFTWTAAVNGNPNDSYSVSGYATANGPITTATTISNVQDVDGYNVTIVSTSTGTFQTNAFSVNEELDWTITNYACSNINKVSISIPAGWTFANDGYALVTNTTTTQQVETWNPLVGTTFTSPNATDRIPPNGISGAFYLVFSQTPASTGNYNFDVTITDDLGVVRVKPSTITVNPFNTGTWNSTGTSIWQETIQ
ncbi:MAG: hypothetical protein WA946_04065 [Nitrospirota bacterium]